MAKSAILQCIPLFQARTERTRITQQGSLFLPALSLARVEELDYRKLNPIVMQDSASIPKQLIQKAEPVAFARMCPTAAQRK